MKLIMLVFSLIGSLFSVNNPYEVNDDEYLIKEEGYDSFSLTTEDEMIIFNEKYIHEYYHDKRKVCEVIVDNLDNETLIKLDDESYSLFFINDNNELVSKIIDINGNLISEYIINNLIDINHDIDGFRIIMDTFIYLFINMDDDIYLYKLDYHNDKYSIESFIKYNGYGREEAVKIIQNDDYLYMVIYKDNNSGGDYGNGGSANYSKCISLLKIDKNNFEIKKIKYFESKTIINFDYVNYLFNNYEDNLQYLYLITNNELYIFDNDLNTILGSKFTSNCIFGIVSLNKSSEFSCARFLNNGIEIIKINNEKKYNFSFNEIIDSVFYFDDRYYLIKDKKINNVIDLYYLGDFKSRIVYESNMDKPSYNNTYIYSFTKRIERTNFKTIGDFDTFVSSDYIVFYFYGNLELKTIITVNPFINCFDGLIYPVGYKLRFNLKAYLDGYEIINDYELKEEGLHTLVLYKDNEIYKDIKFEVSSKMINIDNDIEWITDYDYYGYVGDIYYARIKINCDKYEEDINDKDIKISVNGEIIDNNRFSIERRENDIYFLISLKLNNKKINNYNIDYIKIDDSLFALNKLIKIYGMDNNPNIDIEYENNNKKININMFINDIDKTLRYFYIDYYKNNILIKREKIAISIDNIDDLISNINFDNIKIGVVYDIKYKYLQEDELFEIKETCERIDYRIINKEEGINEISFEIHKRNLNSVLIGNNIIYSNNSISLGLLIISSIVIILIGAFAFLLIIRKKIKKNEKKENEIDKNLIKVK